MFIRITRGMDGRRVEIHAVTLCTAAASCIPVRRAVSQPRKVLARITLIIPVTSVS